MHEPDGGVADTRDSAVFGIVSLKTPDMELRATSPPSGYRSFKPQTQSCVQRHPPGGALPDSLIDKAVAVFLHQAQTTDHVAFCDEAVVRARFGAAGEHELAFAGASGPWRQWMERVSDGQREVAGADAPQPHTMCVLPGTSALDMLKDDPTSTGVCLPHAVTAASGGGRRAALERHRGNRRQQKRVEAVYSRLQRSGATHLAAWAASKPTRAAEAAATPPAGAAAVAQSSVAEPPAGAAVMVPSSVAKQPSGTAAAAPSSVAKQPAGTAAAAPSSVAKQPAGTAAAAPSRVAEQPAPRSGGSAKKKGKARKRVAHVTVDTNVMD